MHICQDEVIAFFSLFGAIKAFGPWLWSHALLLVGRRPTCEHKCDCAPTDAARQDEAA